MYQLWILIIGGLTSCVETSYDRLLHTFFDLPAEIRIGQFDLSHSRFIALLSFTFGVVHSFMRHMAQPVMDLNTEKSPTSVQQTTSRVQDSGEPLEVESDNDDTIAKKKPLAFYLAFLGITITVLVFSLDATTLAVAIPVSFGSLWLSLLLTYSNPILVYRRALEWHHLTVLLGEHFVHFVCGHHPTTVHHRFRRFWPQIIILFRIPILYHWLVRFCSLPEYD